MLYRYLLLFILPVIGIIIYLDGQNYNPVLLDFQPAKNASPLIISYLPKKNGIYQRVGQIRQYSKDNLYEYINGHAEFFLSFGFEKLAVADYSSEDPEKNSPEFVVDIYDMRGIENAFGVLMAESGKNSNPVEIGFRGFLTQRTLNFVKGAYYIKINAYIENAPLAKFARELENLLGIQENSIPQFEKFPEYGIIKNSVKFFKENYHGLGFANKVFEQGYEINGERFKAFLIEGSNDEITKLLNQYFEFFKEDNIKYKTVQYNNRRYYKILDPFEGNWFLIPLEKDLFGVYGSQSDEVLKKFVESLTS